MGRMEHKVVLICGGARDIGFAIADRLANEGAHVYIIGRRADEIGAAAAKIGDNAHAIVGDASDPADLQRAVAIVRQTHQYINGVVYNAAISSPGKLVEETPKHVLDHFRINAAGAVFAVQAAIPAMKTGSSAVLIGSVAGRAGYADFGTYAATKAALRSYTRTWTVELAPLGIRVNTLSPGPTTTSSAEELPGEVLEQMIALVPLGRMARTDEIAAAALFLLSDEASFVAGIDLCVDGGMKQV